MIYYALTIVVQILCVMHVVRTGREKWWIMLIIFLPLVGMAAYFLIEVLPDMQGDRRVRYARKVASNKLDPEKDIRGARDALEIADTVANRTRLADALVGRGDFDAAIHEYETALSRPGGSDDRTRFKYAQALFEAGRGEEALTEINRLSPVNVVADSDRRALLKARVLDFLGRKNEAATLYEDVIDRYAGIEARCRYAAMLIEQGEDLKAREQLREVEKVTRSWDAVQIGDDKPMLDWARRELKRIGG